MLEHPRKMKNIHLFTNIMCLMIYNTIAVIPEVGLDKKGNMRGKPQQRDIYHDSYLGWYEADPNQEFPDDNDEGDYMRTDAVKKTNYCDFLRIIGSQTICNSPCNWWDMLTDVPQQKGTCASKMCDTDSNVEIEPNNVPCNINTNNYIIATPVLHRPSGLLEPEICECVDPTDKYGETCKRQGIILGTETLFAYPWCYLKNDKSYCPRAYDVNHDGRFRAINGIYTSENNCQGSQNKEVVKTQMLGEWNMGSDELVYHEKQLMIRFAKRSRSWTTKADILEDLGYFFSGGNTEKPKDVKRWAYDWRIASLGSGSPFSGFENCPTGKPYTYISNLFAVHVPECRDTEQYQIDTRNYKTRSNCISFVAWQKVVVENMDRNKLTVDDGYKLVSLEYVRFLLPVNIELELYQDTSCGISAHNDRMASNGRLRLINAPDLTTYSWKYRRTDSKRCLSHTGNGMCDQSEDTVAEYAIDMGWDRNARSAFNCHMKADGEHHYRDTERSDNTGMGCGMRYKQWKECPANMRANVALDNCEFCEAATPSRPTSTSHCVACGSGQWFPNWGQAGSACDFLEVVVYEKGTDAQGTGWKIQKGSDITDVATHHFNYYATSTDQTIRNSIPEGWYMSYSVQKAELTQCVNKQDEEDYMYRNDCGAQQHDSPLTGYDPWFYRNGVYFKKDNLPVGIHQIAMGGNKMRCLDCNNDSFEGSYNSNCKANQPQIASNCVACKRLSECVAQDSYLDHFYTGDGCKNPDAVTDTECKKCPVIRVRGPDSHNIVVGCGRTALSRWNDETGEIGDEDGPVMCGYRQKAIVKNDVKSGASRECTYMGKELEQSNNYDEGRTRTLPTDIPYCPPGYWIDENKAGCTSDEWKTTWIHACCRPCRGCPPHEKKMDGFQKCAGNKHIDTEASQCVAMCPTGYWNDETNANTDSAGTCVKCKTSCSS